MLSQERVSKGTRLGGALWPKMGQCEHQKKKKTHHTCDGRKNMKYFKSHEFIMISFIFQRPHGSSLDEAREPIHYFEKWLKKREEKRIKPFLYKWTFKVADERKVPSIDRAFWLTHRERMTRVECH